LIISIECHTVTTFIRRSKYLSSFQEAEEKKGIAGNISALTDKFNQIFSKAKEIKLFNFIFGAILKIISLMNGNAIIETAKCVVGTIETFFTSYNPENKGKSYKEIKEQVNANVNKNMESFKNELEGTEGKMDELGDGIAESELDSKKIECEVNKEIENEIESEKIDDPEVAASLLDGDDELEDLIEQVDKKNEKKKEDAPKAFIELSEKPKFIKDLGKAMKKKLMKIDDKIFEKLDIIKQKLKNAKNKIKEKLKNGLKKIAEKFQKLALKVKELLDKPLVKTIIYFVECALPNIAEMIVSGIGGMLLNFTGANLFGLIKNGPKFIRMLIDGFKSLRAGFKETKSLQNKYINYGKGTASLVMLVILSALGMSPS